MSISHKSSTISSDKKALQPKQILFDDAKKSDLFDCEFEDGISDQNQDRFDIENASEQIQKEDSEDEETRQFVLDLVGDIDGDNPQHPLKQNSSASAGAQMKKETGKAEADLYFGQIEETKTVEIKNPENQDNELRAYLIKDLKKMCRYDKHLLQILTKAQNSHHGYPNENHIPDLSPKELDIFKNLGLSNDELSQISIILDTYTKSDSPSTSGQHRTGGFAEVLKSTDENMVSIDHLIIQLNDFSPEFKLLDCNSQLRNDP